MERGGAWIVFGFDDFCFFFLMRSVDGSFREGSGCFIFYRL